MSSWMPDYPEQLEIKPLTRPPVATIRVPGSKSITNRALVMAALSQPERGCELRGALRSEDTELMVDALQCLGFQVCTCWSENRIHVRRETVGAIIPAPSADLFVGNSGTTMRFLTAMVSLGRGRYRLDGIARMRERPIDDLLAALQQLGVNAYSERNDGYPPVVVESSGLEGGIVQIRGNVSSQFLSGLLMAGPLAQSGLIIEVDGPLVSKPYVTMTVEMMAEFGVEVETDGATHFNVPPARGYSADEYDIEPDASAASYFLGAATITGGAITLPGLDTATLQGDISFVDVLERMGAKARFEDAGVVMMGREGGRFRGIEADMNCISDTVMTLAAVACFADGPTTIENVAHIRHKETDRLAALATELRRVGAEVEEFADGLRITPQPLHGAVIETYNDHRMAMSMALIGLKVPGIIIKNPGCVAKTYPDFFADLEKLRC
jgi:3-phosphoshikimate 1-carboxyvinyltransferase